MSTPYDPGRPEDQPPDQPGYPPTPPPQQYPAAPPPSQQYPAAPPPSQQYPAAPPPQQYPQGGYAGGPPGGQYPPASQYGSAPQYGEPYGGQPAAANPPKEVVWASQLMILQVVLNVIGAIVQFAQGDSIKDAIRESDAGLTPDEVDAAYALGIGIAVFIGLVLAVLYILLAIQVRKGKNWARIVTWVLAGLSLFFGLLGLAAPQTGIVRLLGILGLLINAAIIVLLALKPSNEYFASRRNAPRY